MEEFDTASEAVDANEFEFDLEIPDDEPVVQGPSLEDLIKAVNTNPELRTYINGLSVGHNNGKVVTDAPDIVAVAENTYKELDAKLREAQASGADVSVQQDLYDKRTSAHDDLTIARAERAAEKAAIKASANGIASARADQYINHYKKSDSLYKHYGAKFEAEIRDAVKQNPQAFLDPENLQKNVVNLRSMLIGPVLEKAVKNGKKPTTTGVALGKADGKTAPTAPIDPFIADMFPELYGKGEKKKASISADGWVELDYYEKN